METSLLSSAASGARRIAPPPVVATPSRGGGEPVSQLPEDVDAAFAAILQETVRDVPAIRLPAPIANFDRATVAGPRRIARRTNDDAPVSNNDSRTTETATRNPAASITALRQGVRSDEETRDQSENENKKEPVTIAIAAKTDIPFVEPVELTDEAVPVAVEEGNAATIAEPAPEVVGEHTSFELNLSVKMRAPDHGATAQDDAVAHEIPDIPVETLDVAAPAHDDHAGLVPETVMDAVPTPQMVNMTAVAPAAPQQISPTSSNAREVAAPAPPPAFEAALPPERSAANAGTVQRIGLVLREADHNVRIDIRQGSDGVRVAVRTTDNGMTQHLREGLPELITRLDAQGFDPKVMDSPQDRRNQSERDAPRDHPRQRRRPSAWDPGQNQ